MMSEPRRMHPAAVILNFIKGLVETVKNFIIPFGVVIFLNQSQTVKMIAIAAAGAVFHCFGCDEHHQVEQIYIPYRRG